MVDVIANERGYYGGEIRESGERFSIPDEVWKVRRPKWVRLAAFGGKGDHDGDGFTGGSKPDADKSVDDMTLAELKAYASENDIELGGATKKSDVLAAIHAGGVEREPFADAPDPETLSEAQRQNGGIEPDWIAPEPVND